MPDVTQILRAIDAGDAKAAAELLPVVYDELRKLAGQRMKAEAPGHTLEPTALVHEAYIRLIGKDDPLWQNRGHFFAAAAEAMRRILIEEARRNGAIRHGGGARHLPLQEANCAAKMKCDDLIALDEALARLEAHDALSAQLIKLRFFAGMDHAEAARFLGLTLRTAERNWTYARTWLFRELSKDRAGG